MPTIYKPKRKRTYDNPYSNREERQKVYRLPQWRKLSKWYLTTHPLCEECLKGGVITPSEHVHHIVSFMNYDELKRIEVALDPSNLEALCSTCHNLIHNPKGIRNPKKEVD